MTTNRLERFFSNYSEPVAPGVTAITSDTADGYIVMWVKADNPGIGAVSAWLDTLPRNRRIVFIGPGGRLVGMLERRGFKPCHVLSPGTDRWVDAHVRRPHRTERP